VIAERSGAKAEKKEVQSTSSEKIQTFSIRKQQEIQRTSKSYFSSGHQNEWLMQKMNT
jgi:hypothetical protein